MLEDVLQNRHYTLLFVQSEVLQKKPIDEAYKSFCKILGDDVMDYKEFDFWYYHFLNENFDLDYDRSKDPKKPELKDMPVNIVEKIVKELKPNKRYQLPLVSSSFCNIMHTKNLLISDFLLTIKKYSVHLYLNGNSTFGSEITDEISINKITSSLNNNSKLKFEDFQVDFGNQSEDYDSLVRNAEAVEKIFKSFNYQIHVENLKINCTNEEEFITIIPYVKPGVLRKIKITSSASDSCTFICDELIELEQFKQAKSFSIYNCEIPIASLFHLDYIDVNLGEISMKDVNKLKNNFLTNPSFEYCVLYQQKLINQKLKNAINSGPFPIAGTDKLFKIEAIYSAVHFKVVSKLNDFC